MGNSELVVVFEAFNRIDRFLTVALAHADVIAAALPIEPNAIMGLQTALEDAVLMMRDIRAQVLDDEYAAAANLRELALRERIAAVVMQVAELRVAEPEIAHYRGELFSGRFHDTLDVMMYVLRRVADANDARLEARICADAWGEGHILQISARRDEYRRALDEAERAFDAIASEPDFVQFLEIGAWMPSEAFRVACRVLAMLFDLPLRRHGRGLPS